MQRQSLPILDQAARVLPPTRDLPTVRELDALWQEVASRPLWAPPNFWRYLRLRWRTRLRFINPDDVAVQAPAGKVNDCASCTDMCCIGPRATVLLRFRDIATLKDIGRTELMTQSKPQFTAETLANHPNLARQVASMAWQRFPVLRQNSFGACAALTDTGLCGLYPYWPMTCARFPYALDFEPFRLAYSQRCQSFWIHPGAKSKARAMQVAAVATYNERIKDLILLEYAPERLADLGLLQYLSHPARPGAST